MAKKDFSKLANLVNNKIKVTYKNLSSENKEEICKNAEKKETVKKESAKVRKTGRKKRRKKKKNIIVNDYFLNDYILNVSFVIDYNDQIVYYEVLNAVLELKENEVMEILKSHLEDFDNYKILRLDDENTPHK